MNDSVISSRLFSAGTIIETSTPFNILTNSFKVLAKFNKSKELSAVPSTVTKLLDSVTNFCKPGIMSLATKLTLWAAILIWLLSMVPNVLTILAIFLPKSSISLLPINTDGRPPLFGIVEAIVTNSLKFSSIGANV